MDNWFNEKIFKCFNEKNDIIWKKGCVKTLLFDSIPIENYIFSLLHAEIGVGNKRNYSTFEWINERIEPICEEELDMTNCSINLKIELNSYQKQYDEWIKNKSSSLAE